MTTFINIHHFKFVFAWYFYRRPSMRTVRVDWSVKGYHHFKIRPHPEVTMLVEPENNNRYDPFAMKVVMPTLLHIPQVLHQEETRPRSQRHPMWVQAQLTRTILTTFFYSSSYLTKGGYCYSKGNSFYGEGLARS